MVNLPQLSDIGLYFKIGQNRTSLINLTENVWHTWLYKVQIIISTQALGQFLFTQE